MVEKSNFVPVTRESFLQEASFYSALASAHPDDKVVLIRLPLELNASDLDGQFVENFEDSAEQGLVSNFSVKVKKSNNNLPPVSGSKSSASSTKYSIKKSQLDCKVNSISLAQPASNASTSTSSTPLSSAQQMRLGRRFDSIWTVNLDVDIKSTPMGKIEKVVKRRAERPLVEQPKNLRMRLLPFSTPLTKVSRK